MFLKILVFLTSVSALIVGSIPTRETDNIHIINYYHFSLPPGMLYEEINDSGRGERDLKLS